MLVLWLRCVLRGGEVIEFEPVCIEAETGAGGSGGRGIESANPIVEHS